MRSFAPALAMVLLSSCGDTCSNDVRQRLMSPDGNKTATLFVRGCGATTGESLQISVLELGEGPIESGNVFVADDNHGKTKGNQLVRMRWIGPNQLHVDVDPAMRIFRQSSGKGDVSVTYAFTKAR